jgi:hypothetical protein
VGRAGQANRRIDLADRRSLDYFEPLTILFSGAGYVDRLQQIFAHRYKYLTDRLVVIFTYRDLDSIERSELVIYTHHIMPKN